MDTSADTLESEVAALVVILANINSVGIIDIADQIFRSKSFASELAFLNKKLEQAATESITELINAKRNAIKSLRSQP